MSLRSVDMQVLLPKIAEVNRSQPIQNQQDQTQQQQFAAQFKKQTEMQRQQVQNSKKSEGNKIQQETRDKGANTGNESGKQQKDKHDEEQQDKVKEPNKGNLLDIKI